jgi:Helicase conserved C-terminal domain/Type III restriction enzyme, res subunit
MNPLELIKSKLRTKPVVQEHQQIDVIIPVATPEEKVKITGVTLQDERGKQKFDREALNDRLERSKITKITKKEQIDGKKLEGVDAEPEKPKKKAKKISQKLLLGLEEEGIPIVSLKKGEKGEKGEEIDGKGDEDGKKGEGEGDGKGDRVVEEKEDIEDAPKKRRTKKEAKGVVTIPPEEWVDIDRIPVVQRLPPKKPQVNIKVSHYFMNDRERFINFLNSVFEPYRDEVMDDSADISCDSIGKTSGDFSLLTHQKLIRDYMNVYTPYRGLLLYHGLGSGKTCSSIAIAEGFKTTKKVIVMTPASLKRNYMEQIKQCGDAIYKKNQFWQWISTTKHPEAVNTLSSVLNLSVEYINKKKGAWLINTKKPSNYDSLESEQIKSLDAQLDEMIQYKYRFINYNGLRRDKLKEMTNNFEKNLFDDAVVIIDEAHNFISRIVNKFGKEKEITFDKNGNRERLPYSLATVLYELLLSAKNARIVLLTGTPIINYPNEIAILFNILRGYIKTWEIPLDIKTGESVSKERLLEIFQREKILDYMDYSKDKILTITRNPFGFENIYRDDYEGVSNQPKKVKRVKDGKESKETQERLQLTDADFEKRIISILTNNNISVINSGIKIILQKALPDKFDDFVDMFINPEDGNTKNMDLFKRRIIGLTSYFRSAQESLMPRYEQLTDFKVVKIPMSDYQFGIYEAARAQERKQEKSSTRKKGKVDENGIYKDPTSTYRIFSRLYCNFVMPKPPGRPLPVEEREESTQIENVYEKVLKDKGKKGPNDLEGDAWDGEEEGDEAIDNLGDSTYTNRIKKAMEYLKEHESELLSLDGLEIYSPKYLHILENIQDPQHIGLHLVYSQFRTLEGIGIFKMVLEANGFAQFKVKKDPKGIWELDINEEDRGKPMFALYTGTESAEEKELIRNIYNSNWDAKSPITDALKTIAHNNNMGEIIKVLMITSSGSEGINLRSTRYVHIMEPYWHPARIDQVIGRARRICSHTELPDALQTVEVYLYLMTFSKKQIESEASVELKRKDLSKKKYKVFDKKGKEKENPDNIPFTSDETLYEISTIKQEVSTKLITAMKEASIDCAIYSKRGSKEQLNCLSFGEPKTSSYAYVPSYKKENLDTYSKINKKVIEWKGRPIEFRGKKYIYRTIDKTHGSLYDLDSYYQALEDPAVEPRIVANAEKTEKGLVIKKV